MEIVSWALHLVGYSCAFYGAVSKDKSPLVVGYAVLVFDVLANGVWYALKNGGDSSKGVPDAE